ncbi:MAG: SBBP repeat-containing protein [Bacteroidetes bacterium]|nr:SBBP repeat-containing protein [Bacteroidota bacterium]
MKLNSNACGRIRNHAVQFLENKGQMTDVNGQPVPSVLFKTQVPGMDMYLTDKGLTYIFIDSLGEKENEEVDEKKHDEKKIEKRWSRIDMTFSGASIKKENTIKEKQSSSNYNYFYGHCPEGIYGVKQYEKITIKNIYPGIDWVLYNSGENGFKYDLIVNPGANPDAIELIYSSLNPITIDSSGNVRSETELGTLTENAPVSFQDKTEIQSRFIKSRVVKNEAGIYNTYLKFSIGNYDYNRLLRIDPQLVWGTFYGGFAHEGFMSFDTDASGNLYVTGYSNSDNFPVLNSGTYFSGTFGGNWPANDAVVLKFSNSGVLLWATYFGGSQNDAGSIIKIDANNNILVTGNTNSTDFPVLNPFQPTIGGSYDAFAIKFNSSGALQWATYYGGSNDENRHNNIAGGITTDNVGNVFIVGSTRSTNFPVQNSGTYFSGLLKGSSDGFIVKFSSTGMCLWGTYYGGTNNDEINSIATDALGDICIIGTTLSGNFPVKTSGAAYFDNAAAGMDAFVSKFTNTGIHTWSTYFGGTSGIDEGICIIIDRTGNIIIEGNTSSSDFPLLNPGGSSYFDNTYNGGVQDVYLAKFSSIGILTWSTFYGGNGRDGHSLSKTYDNLAVDQCNNIYYYFSTTSTDINSLDQQCGTFFDGTYGGGGCCNSFGDCYITEFSASCKLLWASYVGGTEEDFRTPVATDIYNNLFIGGEWPNYTSSSGLPVLNPGGGAYYKNSPVAGDDSFILKLIPILPTYTQSQVNTCACNGTAALNITCGTAPYNYVWSNATQTIGSNSTSNFITNICAGAYWVEVKDGACNRDTLHFTINGSSLTLTTSQNNATCSSAGTATVSVSANGTAPYTYSWASGGQTTQTSTGLSPGTYTVTVSDINGCTSTSTVTISSPPPLTAQFTKGTANCPGCGCKEWLLVTAAGGTSPYSYTWPDGYVNRYKNNLCPGVYLVNVKDKNGCSVNVSLTSP